MEKMDNSEKVLTPFKRFINLLKVDKSEIYSIYLYAIFNGLVNLSLPLGIQAIVNLITGGEVSTAWIILVIVVITGILITGILQVMQLSISENLQRKLFVRSSFEFAYRIPRMKLASVDKFYLPELTNRFFDTLSIQKGLGKILIDFSSSSLQVIFGLLLLSFYHPFFIIFSILLVLIVFLIIQFSGPEGLKASLKESKYKYEVAHWLEELARTLETFKLAGKTGLPLERTDNLVNNYLGARSKHFRILVFQFFSLIIFKVLVAAGLLILGGLLVINGQMNIGQFVAAEIIIILVIASIEKLIQTIEAIYDVLTAIEKIGTVTDIPLDNEKGYQFTEEERSQGVSIELKSLSFRFEGPASEVLKNINLKINPSEKISVAGFSGSGKSILLQLLAALYEDYQGSITFNNIPLSNIDLSSLRSITGDSLSKEDIFRGTLRENISLNKENLTLNEIQRIVELVGLSDFVKSCRNGYDTILEPEGRKLPKSIISKIKLARAFVGNPKLILLEDHFTLLEKDDVDRIINYLTDKSNPATVITVTNDPKLVARFDRVLVLNKGEMMDCGSYVELSHKNWFKQIFKTESDVEYHT
jgi:ABC-type bacteriocin/lantibiotic exporter with double-glycine peptidase domain